MDGDLSGQSVFPTTTAASFLLPPGALNSEGVGRVVLPPQVGFPRGIALRKRY